MDLNKPAVLFSSLIFFIISYLPDIFAVDPSFDVPVFNVTVIAGKTAILPCSVDNLQAHKVVWTDRFSTLLTYDIGRIIDDDRIGIERPFTNDWNLLIHDVRYSDAGKYVCQINTKPVKTKTVMLHVLVPPRIDVNLSSSDIITREGQTVQLTCNVSGIPPPVVHWYRRPLDQASGKPKEKLEPTPFSHYHRPSCTYTFRKTVTVVKLPSTPVIGYRALLKQGVGMNGEFLIIHNISRYCDGVYECVAFNDVPPAVNKEIKVEVEFPPEIELHTRRIGQAPGKETILECQITAFPMNYIVWRFNNEDLMTSKKHRIEIYNDGNHRVTLSLRVMDITFTDYGNYTCFAQNQLGSDQDVMLLYDHREVHKAVPTTTTSFRLPPMRTTVPQTIWLTENESKNRFDKPGKESHGGFDGSDHKAYRGGNTSSKDNCASLFLVTLTVFLCFVT